MKPGKALLLALSQPELTETWSGRAWSPVLSLARREGVGAILAQRLKASPVWQQLAPAVQTAFAEAADITAVDQTTARWQLTRLARDLSGLACQRILMKGSAYLLAGLRAGQGRSAGDMDVMVPRSWLGAVEQQAQAAGWRTTVTDPYDIAYYHQWMHELPPMQHAERGSELDLHHTILPLTSRLQANAAALVAGAVPIPGTPWHRLGDADMVLHSAVHLFVDADLAMGIRNLWDLHQLLSEFLEADPGFADALAARAQLHGLERPLWYALTCCEHWFATPVPASLKQAIPAPPWPVRTLMMALIAARFERMTPAPPKGIEELARLALYIRSHWLKMPPRLLVRHLITKARKRQQASAQPV
jgi:hypothetical protein